MFTAYAFVPSCVRESVSSFFSFDLVEGFTFRFSKSVHVNNHKISDTHSFTDDKFNAHCSTSSAVAAAAVVVSFFFYAIDCY